MQRLRRYLPPLLVLLPVIFICGKLLLTPVSGSVAVGSPYLQLLNGWKRGWPWIFRAEYLRWTSSAPPAPQTTKFFIWPLLADIVLLLAVTVAIWFALLWCWRRAGYRCRFSLRTGLLLILIVALPLGWWTRQVKSWRDEQKHLDACWGFATFDSPVYVGPGWLERLWPRDGLTIFFRNSDISVGRNISDQEAKLLLSAIRDLPDLRSLYCKSCVLLDAYKASEREVPIIDRSTDPSILLHIEEIHYARKNAASADTLKLLSALPRLKSLSLTEFQEFGAGFKYLAACPSLESLALSGAEITDEALDSMVTLKSLTEIELHDCELLAGSKMLRLLELPKLRSVDISTCFQATRLEDLPDWAIQLGKLLKERRDNAALH